MKREEFEPPVGNENPDITPEPSEEIPTIILPDYNDPAVQQRMREAGVERTIRQFEQEISPQLEIMKRQIAGIDEEIGQLEQKMADRRQMREYFAKKVKEGEEFLGDLRASKY